MTVLLIFAVFSIFWGSLWKIPDHQLEGWVVDFDGGLIGQEVVRTLSLPNPAARVSWKVVPTSQFTSFEDVGRAIVDEQAWVAITINPGSSARLSASLASPNSTYDGSEAISVFAEEARNENAFRVLIRPTVQATLDAFTKGFATQLAKQNSANPNMGTILSTSPQTLVTPVSFRLINLIPFDQPVASAVTFVGLLYQLVLSFFIVMIGFNSRQLSGLEQLLSTRSLIILRMVSSFSAYFFISLFYSLLSLAFKLDVSRKFGHSGFMVFWMLNYVGILSVGLALETMVTVLTIRFIPFFMLTWIIVNVSVCIFPIEVMPHIYRYGKGAPFYNVSRAMRAIMFGTKNVVGFSFGILIVWVAISCITMPLVQVWVRRRQVKANADALALSEKRSPESA